MTGYLQKGRAARDAIRAALLHEWDPIGVGDTPEAADEYDAYVGTVYELLAAGASAERLFEYLWQVETEYMGLTGSAARRVQTQQFAERLAKQLTVEFAKDEALAPAPLACAALPA